MNRLTEREKALKKVQELGFMTDDLRLFLNTPPDCEDAFCALQYYLAEEKEAVKDFEKRYGSLTLEGTAECRGYDWINHAWPWEMEA